jgi:hypothetical protein
MRGTPRATIRGQSAVDIVQHGQELCRPLPPLDYCIAQDIAHRLLEPAALRF